MAIRVGGPLPMDPHHNRDNPELTEAGDVHANSQFPKRWEPLNGSYNREQYSRRWGFNGKDAAATVSTTLWMQPAIAVSASIDSLANAATPDLYGATAGILSVGFLTKWLWQTLAVAALKAVSCWIRNYGASLSRDLVSWLWTNALKASRAASLPARYLMPHSRGPPVSNCAKKKHAGKRANPWQKLTSTQPVGRKRLMQSIHNNLRP